MTPKLRIGLFSIGLDAYWNQFEGLKARLEGYTSVVERKLKKSGNEVLNLGLIDNSVSAFQAGIKFKKKGSISFFFTLPPMRCHRLYCPLFNGPRYRSLY